MAPLHFYIYKSMLLSECLWQPFWSQRKKKEKNSCYLTASIFPRKIDLPLFLYDYGVIQLKMD